MAGAPFDPIRDTSPGSLKHSGGEIPHCVRDDVAGPGLRKAHEADNLDGGTGNTPNRLALKRGCTLLAGPRDFGVARTGALWHSSPLVHLVSMRRVVLS